jgi:hypothetical protein
MKYRPWLAMLFLFLTLGCLYPGLTTNALTIRGYLDPDGAAILMETTLAAKMPKEDMATIRPLLNQSTVGKLGDEQLSAAIGFLLGNVAKAKIKGAQLDKESTKVYEQTQTIIVSIQNLFERENYYAGILVLIFSVCIPISKSLLFLGGLFAPASVGRVIFKVITAIGKWSMADVFLIAIYTAYLAARSSENAGQPIYFETAYGPGFYWFAGYCLLSVASQQITTAMLRRKWDAETGLASA